MELIADGRGKNWKGECECRNRQKMGLMQIKDVMEFREGIRERARNENVTRLW